MTNIKKVRVMRDYTQIKVYIETGISQSTLSKYENGELLPTTENLIKLALYYGTSTDFLLGLTDEMKPYSREDDVIKITIREQPKNSQKI